MDNTGPLSSDPLPVMLQAGIGVSDVMVYSILLLILIVCSALLSASEVAYFSLSPLDKDELKEDGTRSSNLVLSLLGKPKDLLATMLIANNLVNVCIIILSTGLIGKVFPSHGGNETLRFLLEVVGITFLLLLFGEVAPKIYSSRNAKTAAKFMAQPLTVMNVLPPISWIRMFLVSGTRLLNRRAKKRGIHLSSDDLEQALALTKEESTSEDEHRILEGIIKFGSTDVRQIMQSRQEIIALSNTCTFQEVLEVILEAGYSRIPVYEENFDNVIGILYIKDLLPFLSNTSYDWTQLIRKPFFVPENKKIDDLLKEFQGMKMHMAMVVDEYGGTNGLVTLEDVLEEIVGDITDEFDDDEIVYTKIDDDTYLFEGRTSLVDFYKVLNLDGKEFETSKGESDSLGGFVTEQAGRILRNNEYIRFSGLKLIVESSDKRRIKMIKAVVEHE
jgi:gliding motility-associated protein GldE